MIDKIIDKFAEYNRREKEEDDYLLKLRTDAEGVGSIKYGDDTSHGTTRGDHLENATIKLTEAQKLIAKKRVPRFKMAAETEDWFHANLTPEQARVMTLYVVDGMSYREIADKTGKSIGWLSQVVQKSTVLLKRGCER